MPMRIKDEELTAANMPAVGISSLPNDEAVPPAALRLFWERFWLRGKGRYQLQANTLELLTEVRPHLVSLAPQRALDVGCGDGRNIDFLQGIPSLRVLHGLDFSLNAVAKAARNMPANHNAVSVSFEVAECTRLPFSDESIDLVLACDLLNHLDGCDDACHECARVLRPGGLLIANPLSESDPGAEELRDSSMLIGSNTFLVRPEDPDGRYTAYIMRFATKSELVSTFAEGFDFLLPLIERERFDPPHGYPFRQEAHTHIYWQVVCQRV